MPFYLPILASLDKHSVDPLKAFILFNLFFFGSVNVEEFITYNFPPLDAVAAADNESEMFKFEEYRCWGPKLIAPPDKSGSEASVAKLRSAMDMWRDCTLSEEALASWWSLLLLLLLLLWLLDRARGLESSRSILSSLGSCRWLLLLLPEPELEEPNHFILSVFFLDPKTVCLTFP